MSCSDLMTVALAGCVLWIGADPICAGDGPTARPTSQPASAQPRVVEFPHLRIDTARQEISIQAEVCLRSGPLELLLCGWDTKEHESVLRTKAQASHLHGALLLLGLTPGKPAQWMAPDDDGEGYYEDGGAGYHMKKIL